MLKGLTIAILCAACGSNVDKPEPVANCGDVACFVGLWQVPVGGCSSYCILTPAPAECAASDCQAVDFYKMDGTNYVHLTSIHSAQLKSLTFFVKQMGTWTIPSACHVSLNPATDPTGSEFVCSPSTVDFPARDWVKPTAAITQAAMSAFVGQVPLHATY